MTLTAVHKVAEEFAGVASALVNMAQQLVAALGLALFTTISVSVAGDPGTLANSANVLTKGYTAAFGIGAAMLLLAAVLMHLITHN